MVGGRGRRRGRLGSREERRISERLRRRDRWIELLSRGLRDVEVLDGVEGDEAGGTW